MKKQFVKTALIILCLFSVMAAGSVFYFGKSMARKDTGTENGLVLLNEIEQLTMDENGNNPAHDHVKRLRELMRQEKAEVHIQILRRSIVLFTCIAAVCLMLALLYLYHKIVRPFCKLEVYAEQVAGGNLDISLEYERTNFFGAFTWAFDHMRKEIAAARKNEAQAISENKTIIASLYH